MMKFEIKMKSVTPLMTALTVALSLAASLPQAFGAGDGRGISGPDLSGDALPIAVDRQVTPDEVSAVTQKCTAELAQGLLAQIYATSAPANSEFFTRQYVHAASLIGGGYITHGGAVYSSYYQYFELEGRDYITLLRVLPPKSAPATSYSLSVFTGLVELTAPKTGIPSLLFDFFDADFVYDELGQEVSHKTYLKNLRIVASKQTPIRFRNKKTGVETGITLDLRPYAECLIDGIQSGEFAKP